MVIGGWWCRSLDVRGVPNPVSCYFLFVIIVRYLLFRFLASSRIFGLKCKNRPKFLFFFQIFRSVSRSERKRAGRHGTKNLGESTIRQLPRIELANLSARGLVELGFGDVVTDIFRSGVADNCLFDVQPFFH